MVNVIPIGQKGNRFEIKPTERVIDVDGSVTEKPQNFTNYSKVEMIFRDPQGLKKTHEAVVTGGPVNIPLIGLRVDVPNQTIDDTHINDGNDGVIFPPSSYAVSPAPINDGNAETYIEIPERGTLVVTSSDIPFKFPNIVFWLFFRGLTGAQIQLRLQDFSAVDTFVSDVISPNATLPVSAGSTSAVVWQYIQRIQNLGTVTARYSGWDARITGTPTAPAIYNYTGAHIELAGYTRPFTFVEITKGKTLILKRATVQPNTDNLLLNVRGAALPSLRVHFYKQNILQGATEYRAVTVPRFCILCMYCQTTALVLPALTGNVAFGEITSETNVSTALKSCNLNCICAPVKPLKKSQNTIFGNLNGISLEVTTNVPRSGISIYVSALPSFIGAGDTAYDDGGNITPSLPSLICVSSMV